MQNIYQETKYIMKKYNIKANKSLGQNFLISQEVVDSIISASKILNEDLIIEIGPGLGTLTKYLLEKAGKVVCIELDTKMLKILEDRFNLYNNFRLINNDVLKENLRELIITEKEKNSKIKNVKIVANLPYYITTPIIMKLLEEELEIDSITVMIQKEVANRLIAIPSDKDTGAITYSVYYYADSKSILEVPKESFIPEPEVTSKVIKLDIRKEKVVQFKNIEQKENVFKIIKLAFTQRRKTLLNVLVNTNVFENKEQGSKILKTIGLDINIRPEKVKIDEYLAIQEQIKK